MVYANAIFDPHQLPVLGGISNGDGRLERKHA